MRMKKINNNVYYADESFVNVRHDEIDQLKELVKTDANGNQVIGKTFGGTDSDGGLSVSQTTDGGYIIGAETESFGNNNIYIIKIDVNGNL